MGSRAVDRIVGITLGIVLGVAIVIAFVFFGSEGTIDAPRINHTQQQPSGSAIQRSAQDRPVR